jgi:hypothetical protein
MGGKKQILLGKKKSDVLRVNLSTILGRNKKSKNGHKKSPSQVRRAFLFKCVKAYSIVLSELS